VIALEELELAGALAEFDEICESCRGRVVIITPSGDGDLRPKLLHETRDLRAPCDRAQGRGDTMVDAATIDELLSVQPLEGPTE
jgi:hypothetical protein